MKLPEKIKGFHKIRDAKICLLWGRDNLTFLEVAEKVGLTERRIRQILLTNHVFIPIDKEWEKKKRIHWYKRQIAKKGDKTQKDPADLQLMLKEEIEGKSAGVEIHNHLVFFNDIVRKSRELCPESLKR